MRQSSTQVTENMNQEEAFETAKNTILEMRPDADDFYLDEADFEDGNWVIMIGYLRYWEGEDMGYSRDTRKTGHVVKFCCRACFIDLPTCP